MSLAALLTSLPLMAAEIYAQGFSALTGRGWLALVYAAFGPAFLAQLFVDS